MEGNRELLRPPSRRPRVAASRLDLRASGAGLRGDYRHDRVLPGRCRRGDARRRARPPATRRVLRRVDHRRHRRSVQGRAGHGRLVVPELPEVQALAERLAAALAGTTLDRIVPLQFSGLKTVAPPPESVYGRRLDAVTRRGKYLLF